MTSTSAGSVASTKSLARSSVSTSDRSTGTEHSPSRSARYWSIVARWASVASASTR